ncbi:hypothetical protein [Pseudorhodoplanes sinuspersici]|uniref:Uncharacterized protein n=1 Tax=Pseudorhodoplanes sinuspersici TaxID=1235591 RepID=A0A1W6ZLE9_9HYPH|nr:hypothetical protein [Pseudorhodoplanes sinuspersici]ARP98253.1 hypothetical protein CAK95_03465 [Pseudorhodoplanes sinuspersici]RKE65644.1 hypothetical protein DFP91_5889 [Pseudorhodoplanes sinuspersici]
MASTVYFVAIPFSRTEDDLVPGQAQECQSANAVAALARAMARINGNVGAVAFKRAGDPSIGEFGDAEILLKAGETPEDLSKR